MKKIVLLIILLLCLTGCFDYKELDDLAYISGYGIDYKNDEYILTFEILNNKKEGDSIKKQSYTLTGNGKTLIEATNNITKKLSKTPFFSHTKILIVTEDFAKKGFNDTADFIIRNNKINTEFIVVMTNKNTPEEILNNKSDENEIMSDSIENILKSSKYAINYTISETYDDIYKIMHSEYKDASLSIINNNNKEIKLDGMALFKKDQYKTQMTNEYANLYNILKNNNKTITLRKYYENSPIEIKTNVTNIKYDISPENINLDISLGGELQNSINNLDLKNSNNYDLLATMFEEETKTKITEFISFLQTTECDLLGFGEKFYAKYRQNNKDLWTKAKLNITTSLKINNKGAIYDITTE